MFLKQLFFVDKNTLIFDLPDSIPYFYQITLSTPDKKKKIP